MSRAEFSARVIVALLAGAAAACSVSTPAPGFSVGLAELVPPPGAPAPANPFRGRLLVSDWGNGSFTLHRDEFGTGDHARWQDLPPLEVEMVADGQILVPLQRGVIATGHPAWEYSLGLGRTWRDTSQAAVDRAVLPFTLHERNANCVHYGLLSFAYGPVGGSIEADWQIVGETCRYFQFTAKGRASGEFVRLTPADTESALRTLAEQRARRLATRPITDLPAHLPGADAAQFGSPAEVAPADMTVYGFIADGIHFLGGCELRAGRHPLCEELVLPSYSLAKSLFAALALMRAELIHPGIGEALIGEVVEACRQRTEWQDVTIVHALDMATGNYHSPAWMADEDATEVSEFFLAEDHATKVWLACTTYPRSGRPGTRWVYHTSDTYLAGVALRAVLRERLHRDVDLYEALVWQPVFAKLGLSPVARSVRHTYDDEAQPFFGWGQYFLPEDIARLALFLGPWQGRIAGQAVLDERLFAAAMQRDPEGRGLPADMEGMVYRLGFRALDVAPIIGCASPAHVIVLSGYGGIILALFPNDTAYYYFSDGGSHRWLAAARESNRIRTFCA